MGLFCNFCRVGIIVTIGLIALVYLYCVTASPAILLVVAMPGVLGVAFLILWAMTTATGSTSYGKVFVIVYVLTIAVLAPTTWWAYARDSAPTETRNVLQQENRR